MGRNIGKKDNLANLANLERVVIEHKLDEDKANCDKCNSTLVVIGTKSKELLKYKPAELYIEEHITYSYACKVCEEVEGKANIVTTKAPNTFLYKSMASNELLSHVINLKYQFALPFYRGMKNIAVTRSNRNVIILISSSSEYYFGT